MQVYQIRIKLFMLKPEFVTSATLTTEKRLIRICNIWGLVLTLKE